MTTVISDKPRTEKKRNQLEQIKIFPTVFADAGDFETIRDFKPKDATTNPNPRASSSLQFGSRPVMGWRWCFRTDGRNGPKRILRRKEDAKFETVFAVKILGK